MGVEIERKFLVRSDEWRRRAGKPVFCRQGYLALGTQLSVRVRVMGGKAWIGIKRRESLLRRSEHEFSISRSAAEELLTTLCVQPLIEKERFTFRCEGRPWIIDVFHGENEGLVVAEVELASEGDLVQLPSWAGREVTRDPRYLNVRLVARPFRRWRVKPSG